MPEQTPEEIIKHVFKNKEKIIELIEICGLAKMDEIPYTTGAIILLGIDAKHAMDVTMRRLFPELFSAIGQVQRDARSN